MVRYDRRSEEFNNTDLLIRYASESGRSFGSFFERRCWPKQELLRTLRARSPYIKLVIEDVTQYPTDVQVIYRHDEAAN